MRFRNGSEMLSVLRDGTDLYSAEKELYAFLYNDCGSIAVYYISNEEADELRKDSEKYGGYWGGFLGAGGRIYDDPTYDYYEVEGYPNLEWCNDNYEGEWEDVSYEGN